MRQVRPIKAVVGPARAVDDSSDEPGVSMLRSTEIALACGLSDQSAFSNTFRRVIGVAARDYRNRFLQDVTPREPRQCSIENLATLRLRSPRDPQPRSGIVLKGTSDDRPFV